VNFVSRESQCFPRRSRGKHNLSVFQDEVIEGNIEIRGKQNSVSPKEVICYHIAKQVRQTGGKQIITLSTNDVQQWSTLRG